MRRLARHGYIHSSLSFREFGSGTPTVNRRYRVTRRDKPPHMWRRSKRNGRTLKSPRLLVILTRVSLYTTFTKRTNCHLGTGGIAIWWGKWTGYGIFFPPLTPAGVCFIGVCRSTTLQMSFHQIRARRRPTVRQQRPPSVKHQAPVNIYNAPPLPSAVLLVKYVFTWEINRGKWNYTRSIVKVSYCITWV